MSDRIYTMNKVSTLQFSCFLVLVLLAFSSWLEIVGWHLATIPFSILSFPLSYRIWKTFPASLAKRFRIQADSTHKKHFRRLVCSKSFHCLQVVEGAWASAAERRGNSWLNAILLPSSSSLNHGQWPLWPGPQFLTFGWQRHQLHWQLRIGDGLLACVPSAFPVAL